jgi:hypothetical protein
MDVFNYQNVNKPALLKAPVPSFIKECLVSEFMGTAVAELSSDNCSRSGSVNFQDQIFYHSQERNNITSYEIKGRILFLSLTLQNIIKMIILLLNYTNYLTHGKNSFMEGVFISVEKHKKR